MVNIFRWCENCIVSLIDNNNNKIDNNNIDNNNKIDNNKVFCYLKNLFFLFIL